MNLHQTEKKGKFWIKNSGDESIGDVSRVVNYIPCMRPWVKKTSLGSAGLDMICCACGDSGIDLPFQNLPRRCFSQIK